MAFNFLSSWLTSNLVTSPSKKTSRLRVDSGQTGFWENREYRFDVEVTADVVYKFSSPVNFILRSQTLTSHDGVTTFTAWSSTQGTAGGTFGTVINTLPNNAMTDAPSYTEQVTITTGGTFTPTDPSPSEAREYIKVASATATAQRNTVGGGGVPERGLPPGDYYLVFTGTDGSYRLVFEERP